MAENTITTEVPNLNVKYSSGKVELYINGKLLDLPGLTSCKIMLEAATMVPVVVLTMLPGTVQVDLQSQTAVKIKGLATTEKPKL